MATAAEERGVLADLGRELERVQWARIEILESVDELTGYDLQAPHLKAAVRRAAALGHLVPWSSVPKGKIGVYQNRANWVRMNRVLDLVVPGERVLDIGVNYGYLSGLILRE